MYRASFTQQLAQGTCHCGYTRKFVQRRSKSPHLITARLLFPLFVPCTIHILSRSALREVFLRKSPVGVLRVWAPWGCFSLFLPTLLDDAPFCILEQKENRQNEKTKLCPCINLFTSSDVQTPLAGRARIPAGIMLKPKCIKGERGKARQFVTS